MSRILASSFEKVQVPLCFTGASLLYAWSFLAESGSPNTPEHYSALGALVPLVLALAWRHVSDRMARQCLPLAFAVLGSVGTLVEISFVGFGEGSWLGAEIRMASSAALLLFWCTLYARLPLVKAAASFALMQVFSLVLFFLLGLLPAQLHGGMALLMPLLSTALLLLANEKADRLFPLFLKSNFTGKPLVGTHMRWRFLCAAFMCAFAYGIGRIGAVPDVNIVSYGLSGIALLAIIVLLTNRFSVYSVFNAALPLVLIGLIALAVEFSFASTYYSKMLLNTGYALSTGAFVLLVADKSYRFGVPSLWAAGLLRATLAAGVFAGSNLEPLLDAFFHTESQSSQVAYGMALFFVALAAVIWLQDKDAMVSAFSPAKESVVSHAEDRPPSRQIAESKPDIGAFKQELMNRCQILASDYKLSKREAEVLGYLSLDWSAPRIEEKLCISNSTVKTHIKHIYVKLGIHSRDELKILLGVDKMPEKAS